MASRPGLVLRRWHRAFDFFLAFTQNPSLSWTLDVETNCIICFSYHCEQTTTTLTKHGKSKSWKGIVLAQVLRDCSPSWRERKVPRGRHSTGNPRTGTPHAFTTPEARSKDNQMLTLGNFPLPFFVRYRTITYRTVRSTFKTGFSLSQSSLETPSPMQRCVA